MIDPFDGFSKSLRKTYRCPICRMPMSAQRLEIEKMCKVCRDKEWEAMDKNEIK